MVDGTPANSSAIATRPTARSASGSRRRARERLPEGEGRAGPLRLPTARPPLEPSGRSTTGVGLLGVVLVRLDCVAQAPEMANHSLPVRARPLVHQAAFLHHVHGRGQAEGLV